MEVRVSQHAVERFQKRFAPELGFWQARMVLKDWMRHAVPLKERTTSGDEQYEYGEARFVLKRDPGFRKPIVVTVLYSEAA